MADTEIRRLFTVWHFTSPSSGETAIVAQHGEPCDLTTQHEYQRVMWRGLATSKQDALTLYAAEDRHSVGGNGSFTLEEAKTKAQDIFQRSGVFVSIEKI